MVQQTRRGHVEPELLTVDQAAEMLNVGRTTVFGLLRDGELPRVRIGNLVRIPIGEVRGWIDRQLQTGDTQPAA